MEVLHVGLVKGLPHNDWISHLLGLCHGGFKEYGRQWAVEWYVWLGMANCVRSNGLEW